MIDYLRPEQAVDVIIQRMRKRIAILRDTKINGYEMVIAKLETFLKQLEGARSYIVNVSSKLPPRDSISPTSQE